MYVDRRRVPVCRTFNVKFLSNIQVINGVCVDVKATKATGKVLMGRVVKTHFKGILHRVCFPSI